MCLCVFIIEGVTNITAMFIFAYSDQHQIVTSMGQSADSFPNDVCNAFSKGFNYQNRSKIYN